MLELNAVGKAFGKKTVLRDVSICFPETSIALLGPNGAGKTTLLRTILGLYRCKQGKLLWDGQDATNNALIPSVTGYLPQSFGVLPNLTCYEMLDYFAILKNLPRQARAQEIERCLDFVHLSDRSYSRCKTLSGGMLRRLGIAQALLGNPKLLILDEPTAGLDPEERLRFKLLLQRLERGKTVLISTHIVDDVEALCEQAVVMDRGTLLFHGSVSELASQAGGLCWRVAKEDAAVLPDGAYIRAMRHFPEGECLIVLSEKKPDRGMPLAPTVEDGYLCVLKGIGQ